MGLEGFSLGHVLVVLVIIALLFGTKHLRTLGSDLGMAIKGFRNAFHGEVPDAKEHPKDGSTGLA